MQSPQRAGGAGVKKKEGAGKHRQEGGAIAGLSKKYN